MELQTRLVFIDTNAFEKKNYQFGQHSLGRLQELIEDKKIHLLITDVTRKEVDIHLKRKSEEVAFLIKKIQKDAMFLRILPTVLNNEVTVKHKEKYFAHLTLDYDGGLKAKAYIEELNFQDTYFELTDNTIPPCFMI